MLRQHSQSVLSKYSFTLLSLTPEQSIIEAEKKKVVTYLAARIIVGNARSKVDMNASNGYQLSRHLQLLLDLFFDIALQQLPEEAFLAVLKESVTEAMDCFKVPDITEEVENQFLMLIDTSIGEKARFHDAIQRALHEKLPEDLKAEDISANKDTTSMLETISAFIRCGAIVSFRKMFNKMDADDRDKLIEKFGSRMLHEAIRFRQVEFVKELLQYNIDANRPCESLITEPYGESAKDKFTALAYVLGQTIIDCLTTDEKYKSFHAATCKFFETSHYMGDYKMPPYQAPDFDGELKACDSILSLLLRHGADPDKTPGSNENALSFRNECIETKRRLVIEAGGSDSVNLDKRTELIALLDKIISAPSLQPAVTLSR